jgi:hypothetical protein
MDVHMSLLRRVRDQKGQFGVTEDSREAYERFENEVRELERLAVQGVIQIKARVPNGRNSHSRYTAVSCELTYDGEALLDRPPRR